MQTKLRMAAAAGLLALVSGACVAQAQSAHGTVVVSRSVVPVTPNTVQLAPVPPITGPYSGSPHQPIGIQRNFPYSDAEAARFLTMATFGPTRQSIAHLRAIGYNAWFAEQIAMPATRQRPQVEALNNYRTNSRSYQAQRANVWLATAVTAPDQLRQKMAWELSQIFVSSDMPNAYLGRQAVELAEYQDLLARDGMADTSQAVQGGAVPPLGTYERLLSDVTYSTGMGDMLSGRNNLPANPKTGLLPDENYAREVMQLFTIGLYLRHQDFSLMLSGGQPIPSYTQTDISTNAKIFTGLNYQGGFNSKPITLNSDGVTYSYTSALYSPMVCYEAYHDESVKLLLNGSSTPGGSNSCTTDVAMIIGVLAHHPNTAPFISRQLIQRFTSSNPSPQYIQRVSNVFANNGHGIYGDLGAVLKAILLDPEARQPSGLPFYYGFPTHFGKAREPLLKLVAFWRYYGAASTAGTYQFNNPQNAYGEAPLAALTVFNFYLPDYMPEGEMSVSGLYGPEFQIMNASTLFSAANDLSNRASSFVGNPSNNAQTIAVDLSGLFALAANPSALVAQVNHDLMYGSMSPAMAARLIMLENSLSTQSVSTRVVSLLDVVLASPEFAIQR
jgi:uncharacterized protein (DUF1800 family)